MKTITYPLIAPNTLERRSRVALFFEVFWAAWVAMLLIGDPIANWVFGENDTATHFLATHISVSLRVPIIAWVAWHFVVVHVRG
jgi:hypothetical protein